ncbi:uncharacterized protein PITG_08947 [Phytophthora infestans T30-4]|uniref:J domain-containing protein n=2 Tax=Phytophthora infestans TaxID=4787 RepID=D0NDK2_PHYIT|nr:uncharacterized protein PITG_08947 [Phytophthora infestans T30-4]EEY56159.1 conserved hypothetical protein [Phytophthora infestans T30-4]KAF4043135.1 DnaJ domain [Phytophthora infestans]KAF4130893.1 DnaJ domain [Phytophthora infestans]|eukprot:XP_002902989.1 conserved hypothetical protein [Phytophthora infestans T30-4]
MIPRSVLRVPRSRSYCTTAASSKLAGACVVPRSPISEEEKADHLVSSHFALQRQQLEFCCLLCGWDVACKTCPFNWFNFDPRKFRTKQRRRRGDGDDLNNLAASEEDIRQALEALGIDATPIDGFDRVSFTQQQVKDAFRAKALEWHPDCNPDPEAENIFKEILLAYELLLAHAR